MPLTPSPSTFTHAVRQYAFSLTVFGIALLLGVLLAMVLADLHIAPLSIALLSVIATGVLCLIAHVLSLRFAPAPAESPAGEETTPSPLPHDTQILLALKELRAEMKTTREQLRQRESAIAKSLAGVSEELGKVKADMKEQRSSVKRKLDKIRLNLRDAAKQSTEQAKLLDFKSLPLLPSEEGHASPSHEDILHYFASAPEEELQSLLGRLIEIVEQQQSVVK
jgi:hypothetical protein